MRFKDIDVTELHRRIHKSGAIMVAEIDDDPRVLDGMKRHDFAALRMAHAVQCTTPVLATVCDQWNNHIAVFANQVTEISPEPEISLGGMIRVFYGSQNRRDAWEPLVPTLNRMLRSYGDGMEFVVVHDREFHDALDAPHKEFHDWMDYRAYRDLMRTCDIAILPMGDSKQDRCKSEIKLLECAAEGVVAIASPTVYGDFITHGQNGFIFKDAAQLVGILIKTASDRDLRLDVAERAYTDVRAGRLLGIHYRARYHWYLSLLTHRDELEHDLLNRCPELR
jgi:hypothetical protein